MASTIHELLSIHAFMKIFRALGVGLIIVILRILMPHVFASFQDTLLTFFTLVRSVFAVGGIVMQNMPAAVILPQIPPLQ